MVPLRSARAPPVAAALLAVATSCCGLRGAWAVPFPGPAWDYETWSRGGDSYQAPLPEYIPPEVQHVGKFKHNVEVRKDGTVWVSGRNDYGQLGDGTTIHRGEPRRVKSAVKYVAGVPVKVMGLANRPSVDLDLLDGPTGTLEEYDYATERWTVRMDTYAGNVAVLAGRPEELEPKFFLDDDVPPANTKPPQGNRRRSGCRATDLNQQYVYVLHDDGSKSLIGYPTGGGCLGNALKVPDLTLRMYLPRYGYGNEGYELTAALSELACLYTPACKACNTYDVGEACPNDAISCDPPIGQWQHEKCRLKFEPGMTVTTRQLLLMPQVELNRRTGQLVKADLRFGMEWEARFTTLPCLAGACDSGNVLALKLPVNLYELNGEATDAAAGLFHSVFLWSDTAVWSTGLNSEGQLGDGTTINRLFPKYVFFGCKDVAAGYYHSVFLRKDGTAFGTGRNKEGQVGDGSGGFRTQAVPVLDRVVKVAAGALHTVYLRDDRSVWATGSNTYGQLGDGSTVTQRRPIKVFEDVTSILAGEFYSLFVKYDPVKEVTTLWAAGLFDAGLNRDKANWAPLQFYNETEVQMMTSAQF